MEVWGEGATHTGGRETVRLARFVLFWGLEHHTSPGDIYSKHSCIKRSPKYEVACLHGHGKIVIVDARRHLYDVSNRYVQLVAWAKQSAVYFYYCMPRFSP